MMNEVSNLPKDNDPDREGIIRLEDDGKKHLWDDPANVKRFLKGFFWTCLLFLLLDGLFVIDKFHKHLSFEEGVFTIEAWIGFFSVYGFISCALIVLIAKQLRKVLMRSEDYYDK